MYGHRFNHGIEIFSTTVLSLSQNSDFTIEVSDLLILLIAICMKICVINVKNFDRNYLAGRNLATINSSA
jgi:hypothetical protein